MSSQLDVNINEILHDKERCKVCGKIVKNSDFSSTETRKIFYEKGECELCQDAQADKIN